MVVFHITFIDLLKAGTSIERIETKFLNLLTILKGFIEDKKPFDKLEIDTAVKEIVQAMDLWEYKNPTDAVEFKIGTDDFQSMKKKFEDLLDIEW